MVDKVVADAFDALMLEGEQLLTPGLFCFADEHRMVVLWKCSVAERAERADLVEHERILCFQIFGDPFLHLVGGIDIHAG